MTSTHAHSQTAAEIIDAAPISRLQVVAITLCILVSLLDGFDTQALAFVAPSILHEWNLSQYMFGLIFSATLLGTAIGSSAFGLLADRIGRRYLVIWTTLLFAVFTGACALATNFEQLIAFRFISGIGMGGVIPNMIALASEYAPARSRATITVFTLWGFPMGAVLGGLAAAPMIEAYGWQSVFVLGAAAPLVLVLALLFFLPESLRFLAADPANRERVVSLLRRIAPEKADNVRMGVDEQKTPKGSFAGLFQHGLGSTTVLLSLAMFLSLFLTYILVSWVPSLLTASGMTIQEGILGAVALNLGGIFGSYLMSRWIDRAMDRGALILASGYVVAALSMLTIGGATGSPALALGLLVTCGFFHIGTQLTVTAFTAAQYPVLLRGTGIGFAQAIGRTGSLIGPFAAGAYLSAGYSSESLFGLAFIPAALAAACMFLLAFLRRKPALAPAST